MKPRMELPVDALSGECVSIRLDEGLIRRFAVAQVGAQVGFDETVQVAV